MAFIPIDFSDVPGSGKPLDVGQSQIDTVNSWLKYYTNDKLKFQWQVHNEWLRAPKPSTQYNWAHPPSGGYTGQTTPQAQTDVEMGNQLIAAAKDYYDFTGVGAVFFLLPSATRAVETEFTLRGRTWQTNQGAQRFSFFAPGAYIYANNLPIWSWWMHEVMHSYGLEGHAPHDYVDLNIMGNQSGKSSTLSTWDALISGWLNPGDVYCISKDHITSTTVKLVPMEREEAGVRSAMITLNDHQVLVIESRRKDKWGPSWYDSFGGVTAYLVDTSIENDRTGEGRGDDVARFAVYLRPDGKTADSWYPTLVTGGSISMEQILLNTPGKSLTYSGIKITLVSNGANDEIRIALDAPTPAPVPTPTPTPVSLTSIGTLEAALNGNHAAVTLAAWTKSKAKVETSTATVGIVTTIIGPNSTLDNTNPRAGIDLAFRLYAGFSQVAHLYLIYYGYQDIDWAQAQYAALQSDLPTGNTAARNNCQTEDTCWGASSWLNAAGDGIILSAVSPRGKLDLNHTSGTLEAHEYTHTIQQFQMYGTPYNYGNLPRWLLEGGAEFSQAASVYYSSYDSYLAERQRDTGELVHNATYNEAWFSAYLGPSTSPSWAPWETYPQWRTYDVGFLVSEILAAIKGPDVIMQMYKDVAGGKSFETVFAETFGMTWADAVPILSKALAKEVA